MLEAFHTVRAGDTIFAPITEPKERRQFWHALEKPLYCHENEHREFTTRLRDARAHFAPSIASDFIADTHMYAIGILSDDKATEWWWLSLEDKARIVLALLCTIPYGIQTLAVSDLPDSMRLLLLSFDPGEVAESLQPSLSAHYGDRMGVYAAVSPDLNLELFHGMDGPPSSSSSFPLDTGTVTLLGFLYVKWFCLYFKVPFEQWRGLWCEFMHMVHGEPALAELHPNLDLPCYYTEFIHAVSEFKSCLAQLAAGETAFVGAFTSVNLKDLMPMLQCLWDQIHRFSLLWEHKKPQYFKGTFLWRPVRIVSLERAHVDVLLRAKGFHRIAEDHASLPSSLSPAGSPPYFALDHVSQAEWEETHAVLAAPKPVLPFVSFFTAKLQDEKTLVLCSAAALQERSVSLYVALLRMPAESTRALGDLLLLSPALVRPPVVSLTATVAPPLWCQFWHTLVDLPRAPLLWDWYRMLVDHRIQGVDLAVLLLAHVYAQLVPQQWVPRDALLGMLPFAPKASVLARLTRDQIAQVKSTRLSHDKTTELVPVKSPLLYALLEATVKAIHAKPSRAAVVRSRLFDHWFLDRSAHLPKLTGLVRVPEWFMYTNFEAVAVPRPGVTDAPPEAHLHAALVAIELHFRNPVPVIIPREFWLKDFLRLYTTLPLCSLNAAQWDMPVLRSGRVYHWPDTTMPVLRSLRTNAVMDDTLYCQLVHSPLNLSLCLGDAVRTPRRSPPSSAQKKKRKIDTVPDIEYPPSPVYED